MQVFLADGGQTPLPQLADRSVRMKVFFYSLRKGAKNKEGKLLCTFKKIYFFPEKNKTTEMLKKSFLLEISVQPTPAQKNVHSVLKVESPKYTSSMTVLA